MSARSVDSRHDDDPKRTVDGCPGYSAEWPEPAHVQADRDSDRVQREVGAPMGKAGIGRGRRNQAASHLAGAPGRSRQDARNRREAPSGLILPLKWPGGKTKVLPRLLEAVACLGGIETHQTYFESFLGGGALFHALRPAKARLNDASPHLIQCLMQIRDVPDAVTAALQPLIAAYPPHEDQDARRVVYDAVRARFNAQTAGQVEQAAMMIWLNRTCFNGVWRVNPRGHLNIAVGSHKKLLFPDLCVISARMQGTVLTCLDYSTALDAAREGDLVYLDPPYGSLQGEKGFDMYTAERFGAVQHRWLVEVIRILHARGVRILLSNGDYLGNREAYEAAGLHVERLDEKRSVNQDGAGRGAVPCLLAWSRHAA